MNQQGCLRVGLSAVLLTVLMEAWIGYGVFGAQIAFGHTRGFLGRYAGAN